MKRMRQQLLLGLLLLCLGLGFSQSSRATLAGPAQPQAPEDIDLAWEPAQPGKLISTTATVGAGQPTLIVAPNGTLLAGFSFWVTTRSDGDPYSAVSTDNGLNWSVPTPIFTSSGVNSVDIDVIYSSDNTAHSVWVELSSASQRELKYRRDSGSGWGTDRTISLLNGTPPFMSDPSIAASGSSILDVVWSEANLAASNENIYHSRSTDNGLTWTAKQTIIGGGSVDPSVEPDVFVGPNGAVYVVWQEETPGQTGIEANIWFVRSLGEPTGSSVTWTSPIILNSLDPNITSARNPRVIHDGTELTVSYTDFRVINNVTIQNAIAMQCRVTCSQLDGWRLLNASGPALQVNTADPFNLITSLSFNSLTELIYFHGDDPAAPNNNEQIWGVHECDRWATGGRAVVTDTTQRSINPSVATTPGWVHVLYEWVNQAPGSDQRLIYYRRAPFGCPTYIYLPLGRR